MIDFYTILHHFKSVIKGRLLNNLPVLFFMLKTKYVGPGFKQLNIQQILLWGLSQCLVLLSHLSEMARLWLCLFLSDTGSSFHHFQLQPVHSVTQTGTRLFRKSVHNFRLQRSFFIQFSSAP